MYTKSMKKSIATFLSAVSLVLFTAFAGVGTPVSAASGPILQPNTGAGFTEIVPAGQMAYDRISFNNIGDAPLVWSITNISEFPSWLTATSREGSGNSGTVPGGSYELFWFLVNTAGLVPGNTYNGVITIATNDPNYITRDFPVTLTVQPASSSGSGSGSGTGTGGSGSGSGSGTGGSSGSTLAAQCATASSQVNSVSNPAGSSAGNVSDVNSALGSALQGFSNVLCQASGINNNGQGVTFGSGNSGAAGSGSTGSGSGSGTPSCAATAAGTISSSVSALQGVAAIFAIGNPSPSIIAGMQNLVSGIAQVIAQLQNCLNGTGSTGTSGTGSTGTGTATGSANGISFSVNGITSGGIFFPGQAWTMSISSNLPNQAVTLCGIANTGIKTCTPGFGATNASGAWNLQGNFASSTPGSDGTMVSTAGPWQEWVLIGPTGSATSSNIVSFTVSSTLITNINGAPAGN